MIIQSDGPHLPKSSPNFVIENHSFNNTYYVISFPDPAIREQPNPLLCTTTEDLTYKEKKHFTLNKMFDRTKRIWRTT